MKILIIKSGALGDTVLCFPLLKNLQYHGIEITFAGHREYHHLVPYFGLGKSLSIERKMFFPLFTPDTTFTDKHNELEIFLSQFDRVVYISSKQDEVFQRLLSLKKKDAEFLYLPSTPEYLQPVRMYYIDRVMEFLQLPVKERNYREIHTPRDNYIVIHPGSGTVSKRWNVENFILLAEYLLKNRYRIIIIEGPAEYGIGYHFSSLGSYSGFSITQLQNLDEFLHIIRNAKFYIGNDSGLSHLASFLGIKGIAVFGATDPWLWCPLPPVVCVYDVKEDGIKFPSLEFVIDFLNSYSDLT